MPQEGGGTTAVGFASSILPSLQPNSDERTRAVRAGSSWLAMQYGECKGALIALCARQSRVLFRRKEVRFTQSCRRCNQTDPGP